MTDREEQPPVLDDDTPPWERQQSAAPEAGSSPLAREIEQDGTLRDLTTRQTIERRDEEDKARHDSAKALFGNWDTLDDKGRADWIKGEKSWADTAQSWWSGIRDNVVDARRQALIATEQNPDDDPLQTWLERKVKEQVAFARQRRSNADLMELGLKEGPKTGTARLIADTTGHGVVDGVVANMLKSIAYAGAARDSFSFYVPESEHPNGMFGMSFDPKPMGKVEERALYKMGKDVSDWAEARFPKDEARANEFKAQFGEGMGSMIGFMGPSAALSIARFGMERAGLSLLPGIIASVAGPGTVAGTTGAMAQIGSMSDDALKAFKAGKTVDGVPVDENAIFAATLLAVPIGASEAAPIAHLFAGQKGQWIKRIFAQAYEEGGQEFVQQVAENVSARALYDDKRYWDDNAWDGAAIGGLLGAKSQIIADTYRWARGREAEGEAEGKKPEAKTPVREARARGQQRIVRDVEPTAAKDEASEVENPHFAPDKNAAAPDGVVDYLKQTNPDVAAQLEQAQARQETEAASAREAEPGEERPSWYGRGARNAHSAVTHKVGARRGAGAVEVIEPASPNFPGQAEQEPVRIAAMVRKPADRGARVDQPSPDVGQPAIAVGDEVQWTSGGVDQFAAPAQVRAVTPDGQWAFVEGSNTGIPVAELTKAAPAWQRELAAKLNEIAQPLDEAERSRLEQDMEANLAGYAADVEAVYDERGLTWDLADEDVRSVAFHMAQGLTAEEALERYAVERFEAERQAREEQAAGAAGGAGAAAAGGRAGTQADAARGQPGGPRQDGGAVPGVGGAGARSGQEGGSAAVGGGQRVLQQGQPGPAEREYQRNLRQSFRTALAGKTRLAEWFTRNRVTPEDQERLIDEAVQAGLLQRYGAPNLKTAIETAPSPEVANALNAYATALGTGAPRPALSPEAAAHLKAAVPSVRRTPLARQSPPAARTLQPTESLAIPPDVRLERAVALRERETGKPVDDLVRRYAGEIEAARGTPAFADAMAAVTAAKLSRAQALELAHLVGYRPKAKTTKAEALKSIQQRHDDLVRFQEARARAAMAGQELLAIAQAVEDGRAQRRAYDALGFYSQALEAARSLKQARGTPEQMRSMLKGAGVKDAELQATGLDRFFAERSAGSGEGSQADGLTVSQRSETARPGSQDGTLTGGRPGAAPADGLTAPAPRRAQRQREPSGQARGQALVTRDEIVKHLTENRVEVREARYGKPVYEVIDETGNIFRPFPTQEEANAFVAADPDGEMYTVAPHVKDAKWQQYSLDPSNPTYRETVLHLPPFTPDRAAVVAAEVARAKRTIRRNGIANPDEEFGYANPEDYIKLAEERFGFVPRTEAEWSRNTTGDFHGGHWSEPNVIAHMRTSLQKDAQGRPVFVVDELQSDWGQRLRDGGARDEAKISELARNLQEARASRENVLAEASRFLDAANDRVPEKVSIHSPDDASGPAGADQRDLSKLSVALHHVNTAEHLGGGYRSVPNTPEEIARGAYNTLQVPVPKRPITPEMRAEADRLQRAMGEAQRNIDLKEAELRTAEAAVPGHPLVNTTDQWTATAFKRLIRQAVEAGAERIALPTAEAIETYGMGGGEQAFKGNQKFYGEIAPRNLHKILAKLDPSIKEERVPLHSSVDGRVFTSDRKATKTGTPPILFHTFPLTEKVKAKVMEDGQALFSLAGPRSQRSLEEREAAARQVMETPEWIAAGEKPADPSLYTYNQPGYMRDPAWITSRRYVAEDGSQITGVAAAVQYLADQAESKVPGGVARDRQVYLVIGYPGSGKSTIARALSSQFRAAHMVSDIPKEIIPEYDGGRNGEGVHEESSKLAKLAIDELVAKNDNIIVETLGTWPKVAQRAAWFWSKGYTPSLVFIDTPKAVAMERAVERWRRSGRAVPLDRFDDLNPQDAYANALAEEAVDAQARVSPTDDEEHWVVREATGDLAQLADAIGEESRARAARSGRPVAGSVDERAGTADARRGRGAEEEGEGTGGGPEGLAALAATPRAFTPRFQAALPDFAAAVESSLRRMLPEDIGLRLADRLFNGPYPLFGQYLMDDRVVEVALGFGQQTAEVKGFHEVGHALREFGRGFGEIAAGLYTDQEWAILTERAAKVGITFDAAYRRMYARRAAGEGLTGEAADARIEELLNQERVFTLAEQWAAGTDFGARVNSLLERIARFFEAIGNAFRGLGFQSVDDVFARMASGEIADRASDQRREPYFPDAFSPSPQAMMLATAEGQAALREMGVDGLMAIRAFHGSPHDFDRFDVSKIGTGEGAQAFGHGLYFAEREGVAQSYQQHLSEMTVGGKPFDAMDTTHQAAVELHFADGDRVQAAQGLREKAERFRLPEPGLAQALRVAAVMLERNQPLPAVGSQGRLYEVKLNVEENELLDWDKPLSQQPETVRSTLSEIATREVPEYGGDVSPQTIYASLSPRGDYSKGSASLKAAGIKGIRYLDQGSRSKGEGTYNYVIFSDADVEIVAKDGRPVSQEEKAEVIAQTQEAQGGDQSLMAIAGPATPSTPHPFPISGFNGEVSESGKEDGTRVRTYRVFKEEAPTDERAESPREPSEQVRGQALASFIVSEQPDGAWELSFFRADQSADVRNMIASIEADLGVPMGASGWLTPEAYQAWAQRKPELVAQHRNLGPLFAGMYASPKAMQLATSVLRAAAEQKRQEALSPADAFRLWWKAASQHVRMEVRHRRKAGPGELDLEGAAGVGGIAGGLAVAAQNPRAGLALAAASAWLAHYALKGHAHIISRMKSVLERAHLNERLNNEDRRVVSQYEGVVGRVGYLVWRKDKYGLWQSVPYREEGRNTYVYPDLAAAQAALPRFGRKNWRIAPRPGTPAQLGMDDADVRRLAQSLFVDDAAMDLPTSGVNAPAAPQAQRQRDPLVDRQLTRLSEMEGEGDQSLMAVKGKTEGTRIEPSFRSDDGKPTYDPRASGLGEAPRALTAIIADLKAALGMPVTQGLVGVSVRNRDTGYSRRLSPTSRVAGQYQTPGGAARVRQSTDIDAIAHEGGHHLENVIGEPLRDLIAEHGAELAGYAGQVASAPDASDPGWLSEGFAEWFKQYVLDPERAELGAPDLFKAFNDLLDAERPDILDGLDRLQLSTLSKDYQDYIKATAVERGMADVATWADLTAWEKIKEFYRSSDKSEIVRQWLSTASFSFLDKANPILKTQQALLQLADRNGVRDAAGRPISLKPGEDAYRISRLMARADRIGHQWLLQGVPDYNGLAGEGPSLNDAIAEAMGGRRRFQWSDAALKRFGLYLEARRAIVEWSRFQAGDLERPPTRKSFDEYFQIIQDLEKANPAYRRAAQMVYDYQHRLLTLEWQAGKWSDAQYQALSARKDYYVPFQRDMSDVLPMTGAPPGTDVVKRFTQAKAFKGSDRNIVNPLEAIAKRTYNTAAAVQFNDMVKALAGLSDRVGLGGAGFVERVAREETLANNERTFQLLKDIAVRNGMDEADAHMLVSSMEMQFQDTQVELLWDPQNFGPMRPPIVPLWEKGERNLVRLNDPVMGRRLFESMNGLGREMSNWFFNALAYPAGLLRAGVTMHPAFVVSNIMGDMTAAWVLTGSIMRPSSYPIVTQARGLYHLLSTNETVRRGLIALGVTPSRFADLYTRVGGIGGGMNVAAMAAVKERFDLKELRDKGYSIASLPAFGGLATTVAGAAAGGLVGGVVGATLGAGAGAIAAKLIFGKGAEAFFAQASDLSETITRLGVASEAFKRVKKLDPTLSDIDAIREAAFTATDVLDFNRSGSKIGTVLKLIPFLNTNLQGVSKAYRQTLVLDGERGRDNIKNAGKFLRYAMTGNANAVRDLSPRDQKAVGAGLRTWTNMMILAAVGAALWLLHGDDPEYDEVANQETKNTHFVFKLWGTWVRVKKPFELAAPANITQGVLEWAIANDPRLGEKLFDAINETHAPPYLVQAMKLPFELATDQSLRAKGLKLESRPIVPDSLKRLPPEMQFNAYSSEFAIQWGKALGVSPLKIDYALNNSIAYWGREIGVSSNYFLGKNREAPKWTDVPIAGTMINRVTLDPSRRSASVEEFWKQMGQGRGEFDRALAGYDHALKSGNTALVESYLAGLEEPHRIYAVLNKHLRGRDKDAHPLNRARIINTIDSALMREMILDQLVDSSVRAAPEKITLTPAKQTEVRDILGRLSALETWNALHDIGIKGWAQRAMRDPQPVLDELRAASPRVYEEMMRRRQRQHVGDYSEDLARWGEVRERVEEMIRDEEMLGLAWNKSVRKRKTPVLPLAPPTGTPNFRSLQMPGAVVQ